MKQFAIYEGNMERLQKKMTKIRNKCRKYGCDFHYEEVGEEFRTVKNDDGTENIVRYVIVEAEGKAVVNGWKFIASLEHTEHGNIINACCDIEVPERYYTGRPVCEHCGTNRYRKNSFIVMNEETGEFKQVGTQCLKDFTCGMSAEGVAEYTSLFDELIKGEVIEGGGGFGGKYLDRDDVLQYAAEVIRKFGYARSDMGSESTRSRTVDFYTLDHGGFGYYGREYERVVRELAEQVRFDHNSEEAVNMAKNALEWILEQEEKSNYIHNLRTACQLKYVGYDKVGLLVSLFPAYDKELERQAEQRAIEEARRKEMEEGKNSEYVGNVGDRIQISVAAVKLLTSWENCFDGYHVTWTGLYKIVGEDGNVYTWKTSKHLEDVKSIKGTIKGHQEFRGVKQTEVTRCRIG